MPSLRTPGAPTGPRENGLPPGPMRGRGGIRRPCSPPKRWPRSAPRPPLPARVPPDGRNPLRRPGSGEPWTWRSPRSCGTPCSGAPKTDEEGEGAVQYLGKGTAAALREIRPENPDPDARVFGLRSGRSVAAVQIAGRWASARMPAYYAWGELAAPRGRRPVLRGVMVPRPSGPRRKAAGSPLTAFGLADGPEKDVRVWVVDDIRHHWLASIRIAPITYTCIGGLCRIT